MSLKKMFFIILALVTMGLAYYLLRPVSNIPKPATFACVAIKDGKFISRADLPPAQHIYGMGLTYSQHLKETATEFDADAPPPIFKKKLHSVTSHQSKVKLPTRAQLITATKELESQVGDKLNKDFETLSPMLDYEVELGFVLLESINANDLEKEDFVPKLGFFIANDLSARSLALLGEGTNLKHDYWGISKSFPGFLPMSEKIWIPNTPKRNTIPCIKIETYVNGQVRQSQTTDNMIYTPLEMLRYIQKKYPKTPLQKGDLILTGTPGGVAIATPRALVRLSNLIGMSRYGKLSKKLGGDLSKFLKKGDKVEIRGEGFENVQVEIIE